MRRDHATDRAAILRVIEDETTAYFNKDYEGWARHWIQSDYARRIGWYARGGALINIGWATESASMRANMDEFPKPNLSNDRLRRENITIRISADIAWVAFEQHAPRTGDPFDVPGRQHELRVLERQGGQWKIACCFVLGSPLEFAEHPLIRVDENSTVLWANDAALGDLKTHPHLALAAGKLMARHKASNQRLQASIQWASGLTGYAGRQARLSTSLVEHGALPIVLESPDDTALGICWVIADGGMILVSFNDALANHQRLAAAAIAYGLTSAQTQIAQQIVSGVDLVETARRLGISANTVRTQLKRMFVKTGANSQTALVRLLMNVASARF